MKRVITTLVLVMLSSMAFALPSPKDIEAAVSAGQLSKAESLLREVIAEKPDSAKAHYELGQVLAREGRNIEAREELLSAERIDPSLKFARDPKHFRDLLEKLPAGTLRAPAPVQPGAQSAAPAKAPVAAPVQAPAAQTSPWMYLLIGGGLLVLIVVVARRFSPRAAPAMAGAGGAYAVPGMRGAVVPGAAGAVAPGYGPGYPNQPAAGGMGIGGAVLGGVAGLAAGYGLAKAFEHHEETPQTHAGGSGFVPVDAGAPGGQDYGDFDAGTGDAWDAGDGGSSDDNNW